MMNIRLGKILGISIELHSTFVLMILVFGVFLALFDQKNFIGSMGFLLLLFLSVFVHELFHSIAAISKGFSVQKITLLPIGGMSVANELPQKASDEFIIAVAGPLFNFIVVFGVLVLTQFFPSYWPQGIFEQGFSEAAFESAIFTFPLFAVFWVNLMLGAFNLFVPALPLDGGRILRAALAYKMGFYKATRLAAKISKGISAVLFLLGFFTGNIILVLVAAFVFFGANQEREMSEIKEALKGMALVDVLSKNIPSISSGLSVKECLEKMLELKETALLVETAEPSYVSAEMLTSVKKQEQDFVKVEEICRPLKKIKAEMPPEKALSLMALHGLPFLAVRQDKQLIGFVSQEDLSKTIFLKKAEKQIN